MFSEKSAITKEMDRYTSSVEDRRSVFKFETGKGQNGWLADVEDRKTISLKGDTTLEILLKDSRERSTL